MANQNDDLRPEYKRSDLGQGRRGEFLADYNNAHNLVLLKPEVAEAFPDEDTVNEALMGR